MSEPKSIVSIVRCENYEPGSVEQAVSQAVDLAGLTSRLSGARRVLLKPNLLSTRHPDEAVTTHPAVVEAVGELARAAGSVVAIGDSPPFAGESPSRYGKLLHETGMAETADRLGASTVRFEANVTNVTAADGRFYRSFEVGQAVVETDALVNIPKLKTHGLTAFTGAVKNLFGCVPGARKGLFHVQAAEDPETFAQMLVDLLGSLQCGIHVMDAVVAMEGEGPNAGKPRHVGLILASSDPVALDTVACEIVGIEPLSVHTTRLAHEQGLGCGDLAGIELRGEMLDAVRIEGFRRSSGDNQWTRIPRPVRNLLRRQLIASPRIIAGECVGCGDCARACPVKAITPGKPPVLDLTKCIRCYCCHEVCNPNAVALERGILGKLLNRYLKKK